MSDRVVPALIGVGGLVAGKSAPGQSERSMDAPARVLCSPEGAMQVDRDFFVDFRDRPTGPARAHEVRLEGGGCTTEIFQ